MDLSLKKCELKIFQHRRLEVRRSVTSVARFASQKHKAMHKPILEVDLCCPKCGKGFENKHRRAGHIGKCKGKETETETEKRTETLQEETTSNNKKE